MGMVDQGSFLVLNLDSLIGALRRIENGSASAKGQSVLYEDMSQNA